MRIFLFIGIILLLFSCNSNTKKEQSQEVQYKGALRNIMQGNLEAVADVSEFKNKKHFYALGALENLKGEIQIFDSKPFTSKVKSNSLSFDKSYNYKATLLVYATVKKWQEKAIPNTIITKEQLEIFIEQEAINQEIDIEKPFPFLLKGSPTSFDWHVINWKDGDTIHSHKKHITSGMHGSLNNREVEILGFYSKKHQAIFTHHTTFMHMHVKTDGNGVAGHVDDITVGGNMVLLLPEK
jgi:acetolactate decarboxylase